ncbi:gliding motility-associated C-terminal domain-containing protein [Pontibacter silvestris]|uniref:Gliding motility-associated C-terminal domain-containing protein n=1 Tax=Pontibacter silvestris TaxID=2305183 RepID=A0ABW4WYC5_9BACT|nr:gliding motility-associated C-terminal domain-containing protein [Pontibacter silvestris]MCC9138725.1 gliding motility-associated C-terminal domain-containing protein [Pontibacter silvestris]
MKKSFIVLLSVFLLLPVACLRAQLKAETAGVYIKGGTPFSTDGLVMIPSADFFFNNLAIQKEVKSVMWPQYNSIERLYRFSVPVSYNGLMGLTYLDEELNGNNTDALALVYTATVGSKNYKDYTVTTGSSNFTRGYLEYSFSKATSLSDVTAVTPDVIVSPFTELQPTNILSPNGDGVNDEWLINQIEHYPNNEVKVFDRFGRLVFSKKGYRNTWDGRFNGALLPEDTYYYILDINSGEHVVKGYIGIVRENNGL